jgi:hypothetical protein
VVMMTVDADQVCAADQGLRGKDMATSSSFPRFPSGTFGQTRSHLQEHPICFRKGNKVEDLLPKGRKVSLRHAVGHVSHLENSRVALYS